MKKWYLQTWFIVLLFAAWLLILPPIVGIVLLVLQYQELKPMYKKLEIINDADNYSSHLKSEAEKHKSSVVADCEARIKKTNEIKESLENEINKLSNERKNLTKELKKLTDDIFVEYTQVFIDEKITSEEYKNKLSLLKIRETEFIKSGDALIIKSGSTKKVINDNSKQILRCFNAESENIMTSVSVKNVDTYRNKLQKAFENLNKIFAIDGIELSPKLLEIKLEEMTLLYSYELKKEQEKEEQKAIREQMLEEEKVRREIEREKAKIEKEEAQFKSEVTKLMGYLQKASDVEKQLYVDKIKELEDKLKLIEKDKENVLQREQNTRAGFVYVISNVGSFGDDVYKIGMTRRLEPLDRVKELGDASVPFEFDVHALIFSEDAPTLENILHTAFRKYEVNKINPRKEFFKVPLSEIEEIVKSNYNATVTFTKIAEAREYREGLKMLTA